MKTVWLHRSGRPRVLVFFAGWAMDDAPFRRLAAAGCDVAVVYDYRDLDALPLSAEIATYPEMTLAAWSLGCAAANAVAQTLGLRPLRAVAINGTVIPEDDRAGIPARWMEATLGNLAAGGWARFVRRMCPDAGSRAAFAADPPQRSVDEIAAELRVLRGLAAPAACVFDTAIVADADRILLPENQRECWARYRVPVRAIACGHYPFHLWKTWEDLLA